VLQGKDKPIYAANKDLGDVCVVVNAERAVFTGNKWQGKLYRWHTGAVWGVWGDVGWGDGGAAEATRHRHL
jgi:large subunit ribosomal protein L13